MRQRVHFDRHISRRMGRWEACTRRDWSAPVGCRYSQRLAYPAVGSVGSLELVVVHAGHAEPDWDRLSSSYRLCLADARRRRTLVNCRAHPRQPV